MSSIALTFAILSVVSVVAVLLLGILTMMKGGELNKKYGNKLMIARVGFQAAAVFFLMILWILSSK